MDISDELEKLICTTVGPSLAAFLEPLPHRRNVAGFGRCLSELAELVTLSNSRGRSTRYSNKLQGCLYQQSLSSHSKTFCPQKTFL